MQAAQIRVQAAMTPDGQIIAMYSNARISSEVHEEIKKKQEEARQKILETQDERREKILASDLAERL